LQPKQALWAAISRAARTPSVYETSIRLPVPVSPTLPAVGTLVGNPNLKSESLLAYEMGYRVQPARRIWVDAATFYNCYRHLVSDSASLMAAPNLLPQVILRMGNDVRGQTYGGELSATYAVSNLWNLQGSYSLVDGGWGAGPGDPTALSPFAIGQIPRHRFQIRSGLTPLNGLDFDTNTFYVSGWPAYPVPGLTRIDNRVGWKANSRLQLDFVVQNALQPRHTEFFSTAFGGTTELVKRAVFGKITLQF
jgi:iron complex outermembrane receptor protein